MARLELTVPLRGHPDTLEGDMPVASTLANGISPVKFVQIYLDTVAPPSDLICGRLEYDWELGTAEIFVETTDTAWLNNFASFVSGLGSYQGIDTYMAKTRRVGDVFVYNENNPVDRSPASTFTIPEDMLNTLKSRGRAVVKRPTAPSIQGG